MKVTVIIRKTLEDWWGAEDVMEWHQDRAAFDEELVSLVKDDITAFLEGAEWSVEVTEDKPRSCPECGATLEPNGKWQEGTPRRPRATCSKCGLEVVLRRR